ncbi:hypothetical protein ACQBAT_04810 [Ornithinimicrobium sp. Y1847]|uniref:hypothetical protein n=1 Tax=Ornithinimicrobium sp. Y1847 TaxID=3405419 RepID=UPI003B67848C
MARRARLIGALMVGLALAGCQNTTGTSGGTISRNPDLTLGRQMFSANEHDVYRLRTEGGPGQQPTLLTTRGEIDELAHSLEAEELRAADPSTHVLVLARRDACEEHTAVVLIESSAPPELRLMRRFDPPAQCAQGGTALDVWSIPREEIGGPPVLATYFSGEVPDAQEVGELLATIDVTVSSWDVQVELREIFPPGEPVLLTDPAGPGVPWYADLLGAEDDFRSDLTTQALVAVGYPKCTEVSRVQIDTTQDPAVVHGGFYRPGPMVECAESPYTVDVWSVPLSPEGEQPVLAPRP